MITMLSSVCLLILWISSNHSYHLPCPDISQRPLRASGYCTTSLRSKYTCLYDTNMISFSEQCNTNPDFVTPGEKYVITGNLRNVDCSSERYQPFRLWSNVSGECLYKKSLCDGEGQVVFNNGSLIGDRRCRCDYTKGYTFITRPKHNCSCNPSEEDCSCYISTCPDSLVLSPDYECVETKYYGDSNCPQIKSASERLQTPKITRNTDKQKQLKFSFIVVSTMFLLILAYTVIVFLFSDKIRRIRWKKGCFLVEIDKNPSATEIGEGLKGQRSESEIVDASESTNGILMANRKRTKESQQHTIISYETISDQNISLESELKVQKGNIAKPDTTKLQLEHENRENRSKIEKHETLLANQNCETQKQQNTITGHDKISEQYMSLKSQVKAQKDKLALLEKQKSQLEHGNKIKNNKIEKLETLLANHNSDKENISEQYMSLQSQLKVANARLEKLDKTELDLQKETTEKGTKIETLEKLTANNKVELERHKIQIKVFEKIAEQNTSTQSQLKAQMEKLAKLENQKSQLEHGNQEKDTKIAKLETLLANHNSLIEKRQNEIECNNIMTRKNAKKIATLEKNIVQLKHENEEKIAKIEKLHHQMKDHETTTQQNLTLKNELTAKNKNISDLQQKNKITGDEVKTLKEIYRNLKKETDEEIQELKKLHGTQEKEQRTLRDTIQNLKGNIRVFCRVRPLLQNDPKENDRIGEHLTFPPPKGKTIRLDKSQIPICHNKKKKSSHAPSEYNFSFDQVFKGNATQHDVFVEISQLVQSAIDGYHVCIFAYGQTGSGKTYTMEGPPIKNDTNIGMIPRAVQKIFCTTRELESVGWKYSVNLSCIEIYNNTIYDLLLDDSVKDINEKSKTTVVTDTTESNVEQLLHKAFQCRSVGGTKMNERSSRSHSVFVFQLIGKNDITAECSTGILNLVDLAGSENLNQSLAEGKRLAETQAINKSLSNLKRVITCKRQNEFIPYRDSKLTCMLRNSLEENSKTLMFVHVSPRKDCFEETVHSLQFATEVNECSTKSAKKI